MRDQVLVMDRLLNRSGGQGYIYSLKVAIALKIVLAALCSSDKWIN